VQRCCGAEPCKRPFVAPIVKASAQDTAVLEALACAWLPDVGGFQVTMVWSNEHMPRSPFSIGFKDRLYKAMRLLRCAVCALTPRSWGLYAQLAGLGRCTCDQS
jgi:hypothetical protein